MVYNLSDEENHLADGEDHKLKLAELVDEVTKLPGALFVMGIGPQAVMEGWVQANQTQVLLKGDWVAVESGSWHCHLHLADVAEARFVVEPDVHDPKREAYSVRFLNKEGQSPLRVYFGMYDKQGVLLSDRVDQFHALKKKYSR